VSFISGILADLPMFSPKEEEVRKRYWVKRY